MKYSFLIVLFISLSGAAKSIQERQTEVTTVKAGAGVGSFERGLICKALYSNEIRDYIYLNVKSKNDGTADEQFLKAAWSVACQTEVSFNQLNEKECYKHSNQCIGLNVNAKNGGTVRCKAALFNQAASHTPRVGLNCLIDTAKDSGY